MLFLTGRRSSVFLRLLYRSSNFMRGEEEGERGSEWVGEEGPRIRLLPAFMLSYVYQRNWGLKLFLFIL